jgi:hypothetical protein
LESLLQERADEVERGLRARLTARDDELRRLLAEFHALRNQQVSSSSLFLSFTSSSTL